MGFDSEGVAFAMCCLLCTVRTKETMCCVALVQHLASEIGLAAARTVCPYIALERVLDFALSMAWRAFSVTNTRDIGNLWPNTVLWTVCGANLMSKSVQLQVAHTCEVILWIWAITRVSSLLYVNTNTMTPLFLQHSALYHKLYNIGQESLFNWKYTSVSIKSSLFFLNLITL